MESVGRHAKLHISKPNVRCEERVSLGHYIPAEPLMCHEIDRLK